MSTRARCWMISLLLICGIGARARNADAQITIIPTQPTANDSVHIRVDSFLPSLCWQAVAIHCQPISPDTIAAVVDVLLCSGCVCADYPDPVPYRMECNVGLLLPGAYVAEFLVNPLNPNDPLHYTPKYRSFSVSGVVPTLRRTWGSLKQIYR